MMESKTIQVMSIDRLECDPQVRERFDEESLQGLAQSLAESGMLQPILARRGENKFVPVDGERRLRAARRAGLTSVPVIVDDRELSPVDVTLRQLVLNTQRESLTGGERARGFTRLMEESGWTAAEVARRTGVSESTVSRLTTLLTLPPEVLRRVDAGEIPASTAYQIAIAGDALSQTQLADEAARGNLTRERVAQRVRPRRKRDSGRASKRKGRDHDRIMIPLGGGRSVAVTGPGLTCDTLIVWLEELVNRIRGINAPLSALMDVVKFMKGESS